MGKDSIDRYFGLAIAYLMPGMIALFGLSYRLPDIRRWFGLVANHDTTFAGFLFAMVASIGAGVLSKAVRPSSRRCDEVSEAEEREIYPSGRKSRRVTKICSVTTTTTTNATAIRRWLLLSSHSAISGRTPAR